MNILLYLAVVVTSLGGASPKSSISKPSARDGLATTSGVGGLPATHKNANALRPQKDASGRPRETNSAIRPKSGSAPKAEPARNAGSASEARSASKARSSSKAGSAPKAGSAGRSGWRTIPRPARKKDGFGFWVLGAHVGAGIAARNTTAVLTLGVSAAHLCWKNIYWTVLEGSIGANANTWLPEFVVVGTRVGYPLLLGARNQHELRFGVGIAAGWDDDNQHSPGFVLIPGIRYQYALFVASFDALLPTIYDRSKRYPAVVSLSVGLSFKNVRH